MGVFGPCGSSSLASVELWGDLWGPHRKRSRRPLWNYSLAAPTGLHTGPMGNISVGHGIRNSKISNKFIFFETMGVSPKGMQTFFEILKFWGISRNGGANIF